MVTLSIVRTEQEKKMMKSGLLSSDDSSDGCPSDAENDVEMSRNEANGDPGHP